MQPQLYLSSLYLIRVVSFGAPAPNEYRLVVEGLVPISLQTTQVSVTTKFGHCSLVLKVNVCMRWQHDVMVIYSKDM